MSARVIFQQELGLEHWVVITANGKIQLDVLDAIEDFCHRQRVILCREMQKELAKPSVETQGVPHD